MIDLYTAATPNGQKIHIMLEECGLDFVTHWVDIDVGEQFDPNFLEISPNNKIPALVDHDGPVTLDQDVHVEVYAAATCVAENTQAVVVNDQIIEGVRGIVRLLKKSVEGLGLT